MPEGEETKEPTTEPTSTEEDTVDKKAYDSVVASLIKHKKHNKALESRIVEMETKIKEASENDLKEQKKFGDLYNNEKKRSDDLESKVEKLKQAHALQAKRTALLAVVNVARAEYLDHADLDSIDIDDKGNIDKDSVDRVATKFKTEHSHLVKKPTKDFDFDKNKKYKELDLPKEYSDKELTKEDLVEMAKKDPKSIDKLINSIAKTGKLNELSFLQGDVNE